MTTSKLPRQKRATNQKRSTKSTDAPAAKRNAPAQKNRPAEGKIATIVSLMRRPTGANLTELTEQTGWQAHSVRGAISGNVKRKLGLRVLSEKVGTTRVYRIPEAVKA